MPARNAFDFVERPTYEDLGSGTHQTNKGHERIKKTMNNLKRMNRLNF